VARINSEVPDEEVLALIEGRLQGRKIVWTTHSEIRKVMKEMTKEVIAISFVSARIQDVCVPEFIDRPSGTDFPIWIHDIESQETAIQILYFRLVLKRPTLLLAKLELYHRKV
jgi:hypothetical protein